MNRKIIGTAITAAFLIVIHALPVVGKENRVTQLGDPQTAFFLPALKSPEDARAVLLQRPGDVRIVLQKTGWAGNPADVFRAAQAGSFQVATIEPGSNFPYVAMRVGCRSISFTMQATTIRSGADFDFASGSKTESDKERLQAFLILKSQS